MGYLKAEGHVGRIKEAEREKWVGRWRGKPSAEGGAGSRSEFRWGSCIGKI